MGKVFSYEALIDRIISKNAWKNERELASRLGISPNTWTAYKRGERSFGLHDIANICDILGVSHEWLLFGAETLDEPKRLDAEEGNDFDLILELGKIVSRTYEAADIRLSGTAKLDEINSLHKELLNTVRDINQITIVKAVLPELEKRLQNRLAQAKLEPGTGKHAAS